MAESTSAVSDEMVTAFGEAYSDYLLKGGSGRGVHEAVRAGVASAVHLIDKKQAAFLAEIAEVFGRIGNDDTAGYEANHLAREWADRVNEHLERGA